MTKKDAAPDVADAALLGAAQVRALAERLDVRPTKQWGQNFVVDANTVRKIVAGRRRGHRDDVVVEVGPGLGSLTLALLPVVKHVMAVEVDPRLAGRPRGDRRARSSPGATSTSSRSCAADALTVTELPGPDPTALVANLPYNVSVPVVLLLPRSSSRPSSGSSSWCSSRSPSGSRPRPVSKIYGVPSLKAAWYADVELAGRDRTQRLLARPQRRLGPRVVPPPQAPDDHGEPRGGVPLHRRGVPPATQGASRSARVLGRLRGRRRAGTRRRWGRPADPGRAARHHDVRPDRRGAAGGRR